MALSESSPAKLISVEMAARNSIAPNMATGLVDDLLHRRKREIAIGLEGKEVTYRDPSTGETKRNILTSLSSRDSVPRHAYIHDANQPNPISVPLDSIFIEAQDSNFEA